MYVWQEMHPQELGDFLAFTFFILVKIHKKDIGIQPVSPLCQTKLAASQIQRWLCIRRKGLFLGYF